MLTGNQIRQKYLDFFKSKGHFVIPSAPVIPENDPSVLFTTAGMHPLVPYLLGQPHPLGKRLVDCQKCVRTDDIEEVGDTIHHTFFEMLGNWSLGDYFKKETISWSYEFLTQVLKLDLKRLYITCFAGDTDAPKDDESASIWESLGIPQTHIYFYPKKDNWWGPVGQTGPCGPDTEMHYDVTLTPCGPDCKPGCSCGRFSEIWNDVFMQYNKNSQGKYKKLDRPNVDTGMGLERTLAVVNGLNDDYLTELWQPAIQILEQQTSKKYPDHKKDFRIITDHLRAAVFISADGVQPSNKLQGYILRRLIRRAALKLHLWSSKLSVCSDIALTFIHMMSPVYPDLINKQSQIIHTISDEVTRFSQTLDRGLKEFNKLQQIDGKAAFDLFQTYGFPLELTTELAREKGLQINESEFNAEFKKHQELSRTASAGMFKGGLQDHSEAVTKYHTATHLLHASLRQVLGSHVQQKGSNITSERLRFDFSHPVKLTPAEITQVENLINQKITENLPVTRLEMPKVAALAKGAMAFFPEKYPDITSVYKIADFSLELCGGPHVNSTGEIGRIKITKEESAGSGVRRIYAQFA